jgi:hypothetical protein
VSRCRKELAAVNLTRKSIMQMTAAVQYFTEAAPSHSFPSDHIQLDGMNGAFTEILLVGK